MSREQNDLGGGHSPRELDIHTGAFVPDSAAVSPASATQPGRDAAPERAREASMPVQREVRRSSIGLVVFATIVVFLSWKFFTDARAGA